MWLHVEASTMKKETIKQFLLEHCDPKVKYDGISSDEMANMLLKEINVEASEWASIAFLVSAQDKVAQYVLECAKANITPNWRQFIHGESFLLDPPDHEFYNEPTSEEEERQRAYE